ncbi:MAG TPA: hydroxyacid dehydrogenase [Planctomycetota bacterium]|nr:hydroxyacid dehydrogenase [Planctomycetota bacterium]
MSKPRVLRNVMEQHWHDLFDAETQAAMARDFDLVTPAQTTKLDPAEITRLLADCEGMITCWGSVPLTPERLAAAPKLRAVAHGAGTVKGMIDPAAWQRGVVVCSMAPVLAIAVAEMTMALIFDGLRLTSRLDRQLRRANGDFSKFPRDYSLFGRLVEANVGIVSASLVGKEAIKLLTPFRPKLRIYDPFLSDAGAKALGAERVELDELFRKSEIVSVHTPLLPATINLITGKHLALMPEKAVLVNTSRGPIINHADLLAELKKGRIHAGLDVTDPEPLPPDSPFYQLENVTLTPHVAGANRAMRKEQGRQSWLNLKAALEGSPAPYAVSFERLATLA